MNIFEKVKEAVCDFIHEQRKDEAVCKNQCESCFQLIRVCDLTRVINQVEQEQGFTPCYLGGPCEYQTEDVNLNHGWIPCSERLPETPEDVMCWYEYYRYGKYNRMFQTYGIGRYYRSHDMWCGEVSKGVKCRVIAWQPLPQPYYMDGGMEKS